MLSVLHRFCFLGFFFFFWLGLFIFVHPFWKCMLVSQSCPTLCDPIVCSPTLNPPSLLCLWNFPGKNFGMGCHFLLQGSSQSRDWTWVSCIASRFFTIWATRETHRFKWIYQILFIHSSFDEQFDYYK